MRTKVKNIYLIASLITVVFFCILACDNGSAPESASSKTSGLVKVCLNINDESNGLFQKSITVDGGEWANLSYKYKAKPQWNSPNIQGAVDWTDLDYFEGMSLGFFSPGQWVFSVQVFNGNKLVYEGNSEVVTIVSSEVEVTVPVFKLSGTGILDIAITAPSIAANDVLTVSWGDGLGETTTADKSVNGGITTFTLNRSFSVGSYTFTLTHSNVERGTSITIELHQNELVRIQGQLENGKWQISSVTMPVRNITVERYNWNDIQHPWDAAPSPKYCGTVDIDIDSAVEGDMVSFSANPATGSSVHSASAWIGNEEISLNHKINNHLYSFIMPDGDVTIRVQFDEVEPVEVDTMLFKAFVQALYVENNGYVQFFGKASGSPGTGVRTITLGDVQLWYDSSAHKICWYSYADVVKLSAGSLIDLFKDCVTYKSINMDGIITTAITNMSGMFQGCTNLISLDLGSFDASSATDISYMFQGCSILPSITLNSFTTNTDNNAEVNMAGLFKDCSQLTTIKDSNNNLATLGFNTSRATSLAGLFQGCSSLAILNLGSLDARKATDISNMFNGCTSLGTLSVTAFRTNTTNDVNMAGVFKDCSQLIAIKNNNNLLYDLGFNTSKATSLASLFQGCSKLGKLNLGSLDASNATDLSNMFQGCTNLATLSVTAFRTNTSNDVNMAGLFKGCSKLTTIKDNNNDLATLGFNTSKATSLASLFQGCSKLAILNLGSLDASNATDLSNMFQGCTKLATLDFTTFITNTTVNAKVNMAGLFWGCENLYNNNGTLTLTNAFNTSEVTNMSHMFCGCYKLKTIDFGQNFNTSNVENMAYMFSSAKYEKEPPLPMNFTSLNVSGFDTAKVTDMSHMFYMCYLLTSLNVSGFDTSNVTDMSSMFACYNWNGATYPGHLTTLDLSGWDFTNVTSTAKMFDRCEELVNLSFPSETNFASLTTMNYMFSQCRSLTTGKLGAIISTWKFSAQPNYMTTIYGNNGLFGPFSTSTSARNFIIRPTMLADGDYANFGIRQRYSTADEGAPYLYVGGPGDAKTHTENCCLTIKQGSYQE